MVSEHSEYTSPEFLLTDIDVGLTFMDLSETTSIPETVTSNHQNARKAYETVLHFLSKLNLTPSDRQTVENKLAVLKARLEAAGQRL